MTSTSSSTPSSSDELLRNSSDDSVPWVIQKYGGTSVGKSLDGITRIVESVPATSSRTPNLTLLDPTYPTPESLSFALLGHPTQKHSARPTSYSKHPAKPFKLLRPVPMAPVLVAKRQFF